MPLQSVSSLAKMSRLPWMASEAPFHLFEFSSQSLKHLLEGTGFHVLSLRSSGHSRFLYRLGACGFFDKLKASMKTAGSYRWHTGLPYYVPALLFTSFVLLPCYGGGVLLDHVSHRGDSLLALARK